MKKIISLFVVLAALNLLAQVTNAPALLEKQIAISGTAEALLSGHVVRKKIKAGVINGRNWRKAHYEKMVFVSELDGDEKEAIFNSLDLQFCAPSNVVSILVLTNDQAIVRYAP